MGYFRTEMKKENALLNAAALRRATSVCGLLLGSILLTAPSPLLAQLKAKVTVDPNQPKAVLYTTSIGVAADRWDTTAYDATTIHLLREAGVTNLRFPGNDGIDALYHWSTGAITNPYSDDRAPAFAKDKMFPAVVPLIDTLGSAIVSVNYGSNLDGSGGGEPAEAAAWVAYANGSPTNTQAIGKDSKGNDWKTVGYWAGLRASKPLATDDGFNHLRITHPDPIGILLWTVGNEPWGDGFYGQAHTTGSDADNIGGQFQSQAPEADLHAGGVPTSKDWGKHQGNARVGPAAYGAAVVEYIKAMKTVDPKILVGAFLMQPPYTDDVNQPGKGWNAGVLKAACGSMDFSAVTFWEGKGARPTYVDNVDEEDLLMLARDPMNANNHFPGGNGLYYDYTQMVRDLVEKYKKNCPAGKKPPLAVTNLGVAQWLPAKGAAAPALFTADALPTLLENGAYTVVWAPIHSPVHATSPSFLDSKDQPQPSYYAIKLLHSVALPGDTFVTTTSGMDSLAVHAVKRRDGGLGLLLINKDAARSTTVTVSVVGYNYATKGMRYDYGQVTMDAGKTIVEAPIDGLGANFNVEVPRYGITAIVIPKAP